MKQMIIRLDEQTHQKLKEKVVKDKTSVQQIITAFLVKYLKEGQKK
jgi:predicted HicB family RNase H-like nuclease